ncbi:lysoplasmalogenase family protein [Haliangium sp.]|uniref:lysoplasmalogenase family protein n=1 Tax=Haliangium sp. TaxID=2663208 RepID=UPI003D09F6EC
MPRRFPFPLPAAAALAVVLAAHLAAHLRGDSDWIPPTKALLMPLLGLCLFLATRRPRTREARLAFVALFFSWLGDTAPLFASGSTAFMLLVGFFLVAQIIYTITFLPHRSRSILVRQPLWMLAYAAIGVLLVSACASGAGSLLPLIIVYAVAILSMAILATGMGWAGTLGGFIFIISDSLIALGEFTDSPIAAHGFWVMLTYVVAQVLLIMGVLAAGEPARED